jgi:hypothetical protein
LDSDLVIIHSGNVHNVTGNVNSGRKQESREFAYKTDITTFIDQRIAAPGNRLGEWSALRQALCNLGRNCGMGRIGEKFREEKTFLSLKEWNHDSSVI